MLSLEGGPNSLHSSVFSFAPLEFCAIYMYYLVLKINKIRVKMPDFTKTNLFVLGM